MKKRKSMLWLLAIAGLTILPSLAPAQSMAHTGDSSKAAVIPPGTTDAKLDLTYIRPTEKTKLHNYVFDAFGPFAIVSAALNAGIDQSNDAPPEWRQGAAGYSKRFASNFGVAAVTTTTRYGLAKAFREDAMYYRCGCKGAFPRLRHAVISTFTARRGADGHRALAVSALLAPYAGTVASTYGWYPGRFGAKDAFRMGNYNMLGGVVGNIGLEFLYSGPHSLLSSMHPKKGDKKPASDSQP
jgi:hypothetical protein